MSLTHFTRSVFIVALGLAGTAARAESGEPLSLAEAVELALHKNPSLRKAQAGVDLAGARLAEARLSRLPLVQARETWIHSNNPVFVFGSLLEQGRFGPDNFDPGFLNDPDSLSSFRTELSAKVPVFDQLQSAARIAQARSGRSMAEQLNALAEQQIRFEVLRAYYGVLVAEAQSQVARETVRTAEADVERTRQMVGTGLRVESDLLAAEVQLAQLGQLRIEAEGQVAVGYAALETLLGLEPGAVKRMSGELAEQSFEVPESGQLLAQALEHRPDYAAAAEAHKAAEQAVRGAKGHYLPRVDAFGAFGYSSEDLGGGSSDFTLGASVTLNLFDPGRGARLDQARAQRAMASADAESLASGLQLEVIRARQQFVSARDRLAVSAQAVSQATEALRIVQDRYQEGLLTITEVLRAQTALLEARRSVLQARYDHTVGYAGVLRATGTLDGIEPFLTQAGVKTP